jgi:GT2 family glycosyltransferase
VKQDIAILINSFNRLSLLKGCLHALASWIPGSELKDRCVIVVYDAGSADGSIEWLNAAKADLKIPLDLMIPEPGDDTSFAAGLNASADFAAKKYLSLKYLLFYETDNQILEAKPVLEALALLETENKLAACGFTVSKQDGSPAGAGQPFPTLLNFALGKNLVYYFQLEAISYKWTKGKTGIEYSKVDVVYTSPLLVKNEAWVETAGLDKKLFPFSDCDVDWAKRLKNAGWDMGLIKTSAVIHDNQSAISAWSKSRAIQFHKGRLRYFKRHKPVLVFLVWPVILLIRHIFEYAGAMIFVKNKERRKHLNHVLLNLMKHSIRSYE